MRKSLLPLFGAAALAVGSLAFVTPAVAGPGGCGGALQSVSTTDPVVTVDTKTTKPIMKELPGNG